MQIVVSIDAAVRIVNMMRSVVMSVFCSFLAPEFM